MLIKSSLQNAFEPYDSTHRLLSTTQTEHQVQRRLLLDVVVAESTAVLELLAGEDQALLVWRDSLLVLDLALDIIDSV